MDLEGWTQYSVLWLLGRSIERIHPLRNDQADPYLHVCLWFLVLCNPSSFTYRLVHEDSPLLSSCNSDPIIAILRTFCICSGCRPSFWSNFTGAYGSFLCQFDIPNESFACKYDGISDINLCPDGSWCSITRFQRSREASSLQRLQLRIVLGIVGLCFWNKIQQEEVPCGVCTFLLGEKKRLIHQKE